MKKFTKFTLSIFIFISAISYTSVSALTAEDITMLLNAGIITPAQASILNKTIATPNVVQLTDADYLNCASITADVSFGQRDTVTNGNAVSILQSYLYEIGYLSVAPTGYFGNLTLSAVKAFQNANNINATGYVGPLTRAKIKSLDCENTATTNPVDTAIENIPEAVAPTIKLNADPIQVAVGQPTTLTWSSTNAVDKCKITSKDSAGKTLSSTIDAFGTKSTGIINKTTTYTIVCYNKYGVPGTQSLTIEAKDYTTITPEEVAKQASTISSINPVSGNRGDTVIVNGMGFLTSNDIYFDGAKIDRSLILSQSSTSISFKVPEYKACLSVNCVPPMYDTVVETGGAKIVQVSNANGFSNDFTFTLPGNKVTIAGVSSITVYTPPALTLISINPTFGNRGDTATLTGTSFSNDSIVLFGGFKVADSLILSKTSTSISFTIPPFQLGCTNPDIEICPRLPIYGSGTVVETGGVKSIYIMNTTSKATTTSVTFTLPSKKIAY